MRTHVNRQRAALAVATQQLASQTGPRSFSDDALQTAALELLGSLPHRPQYCCGDEAMAPSVDAARRILYTRARSRGIDEHRAQRRYPLVTLDALEPAGDLPPAHALDEELIDRLEASEWRRTVEASLPSSHRDGWAAWVLKTELGLDAPQIASALSINPATVRQRLHRCAAWIRLNVPVPEEV
jgi:DNA-directed RNA polymerase specialized sigma24 family protein